VAGAGYDRSVQLCLSNFPNNTGLDFLFARLICVMKSNKTIIRILFATVHKLHNSIDTDDNEVNKTH
jgi:hypothetical protein